MIRISVIIPTYNRITWLQEAIDSVLAQTFRDLELIVVDDGSTDDTGEALARRYGERLRYVYQANQGESVARNHGAQLAKGSLLAFLDSDDVWLPDKLAAQVAYIDAHPQAGAVYCQAWSMDASGKLNPRYPYGHGLTGENFNLRRILTGGYSLSGSAVLVRRMAFEQLGGFDASITYGEDLDFCLKLFLKGCSPGFLARPLIKLRTHGGSQSLALNRARSEDQLRDHVRIYANVLEQAPDPEAQSWARRAQLKEHVRLLLFYRYAGLREPLEVERETIRREFPGADANSALFESQADYFIPLVYAVRRSQADTAAFVREALAEKREFCGADARRDALLLWRAYVWTALRGGLGGYVQAAAYLVRMILQSPGVLLAPALYTWLAKLLFGRLAPVWFRVWMSINSSPEPVRRTQS